MFQFVTVSTASRIEAMLLCMKDLLQPLLNNLQIVFTRSDTIEEETTSFELSVMVVAAGSLQ